MIVFDLSCRNGHVFEAWFGSTEDYEKQRTRGLVSCPICDSPEVDKAVMAPRISRKANQKGVQTTAKGKAVHMTNDVPDLTQAKDVLQTLAKVQAEMLKTSDWVGKHFADEARAMHLGEIEQRPIHGQTTSQQAKDLIEEGVPISPLPFPVRPPGADN